MAYAILAGLPPIYGLYTSLVPVLVYMILGQTPHVSLGFLRFGPRAISLTVLF